MAFNVAVASDRNHERAVSRLRDVLERTLEKETRVLDFEESDDSLLLASLLGNDINEERERLRQLEERMLVDRQNRLKVSLSSFVGSN